MKALNKWFLNLLLLIFIALIIYSVLALTASADDTPADTYIPAEQQALCKKYGAEYGIKYEVLEALIECESSGQMKARNGSCYGICQINGDVHGYGYDTEEKQIEKACQLLLSYDCEIDEALARYNGQSIYRYDGYVKKVLSRSAELERIHDYE